MSIHEPPPTRPGPGPRSPDDLDGLLRAYFRTEMPDPWPALRPPPSAAAPPPPSRRLPWGSRSALAASVALLWLGHLALSSSWKPLESSAVRPVPVEVGLKPGTPRHRPLTPEAQRKPGALPPSPMPIR